MSWYKYYIDEERERMENGEEGDDEVRAYLSEMERRHFEDPHNISQVEDYLFRTLARTRKALWGVQYRFVNGDCVCSVCLHRENFGHDAGCIFHDMPGGGK